MKAFSALLLFTFVLCTKQQTTMDPSFAEALQANRTACAKEIGVELTDAAKIWTDPSFPANNEALKCYYKCITEKLGIIDNGKYDNVDTMKFFAHYDSPTDLKEIQDECTSIPPNANECEFAYELFKCISSAQLD